MKILKIEGTKWNAYYPAVIQDVMNCYSWLHSYFINRCKWCYEREDNNLMLGILILWHCCCFINICRVEI
jgi:hypothetical protein